MQASQPAAISTSTGKLAALTRRFVLEIARLSKELIRAASASTTLQARPSTVKEWLFANFGTEAKAAGWRQPCQKGRLNQYHRAIEQHGFM